MSEFNWGDETYNCLACEKAHFTDMCRNTPFLWCNEVRQYITPNTSSWLCHNEHYKSKYAVEKAKEIEKKEKVFISNQVQGQLSFLESL